MTTDLLRAAALCAAVAACSRQPEAPAPAPKPGAKAAAPIDAHPKLAAPAASASLGPEGPTPVQSTSASIYLRNLKGVRTELEKLVELGTATAGQYARLAGIEGELMALDGDLAHVDKGLAILDFADRKFPGDADVAAKRAGLLAHLHRFPEALALWKARVEASPADARAKRSLGEILWNLGRYEEAKPLLATPLTGRAGPEDHALEAHVRFDQGDAEGADLALRKAHGSYSDVHPLQLAWLDFQRGHLRLRTGRWEEARTFFASAHARLPDYITVAEHLAETEALLGNHDEALRLYDDIVGRTGLPEFIAARGEALRAKGDTAGADKALLEADAAWKARLAQHPTAWAAHAIGFWLDEKPDAAEAAKWARANLEVRRDAMSLLLGARALAKDDPVLARSLLDEARKAPLRHDEYFTEMAAAYQALGEVDNAKAAFAQARRVNPKASAPTGLTD